MCARRFLILVFVLTLIAVAAAFAIYQWGGSVLLRGATPQGRFEAPAPGSGMDYSQPASWISHPRLGSGPAEWRPDGAQPLPNPVSPGAATFYIHPTTYLQRDRWNAPVEDAESRNRALLFTRSQASAFADISEVWAPRYRQAAFGAFLLQSDDAQRALDLAYADVRSAFAEFLRKVPADRPIILAGHSQGSLHLLRLLFEEGARLRPRLVAAYVAGWPVGVRADLPATGLSPCTKADQAGCVLSWQSFGEPANPQLVVGAWEGTRSPTGVSRSRADMLCVNPLTGTAGGSAPASGNPGTLVPTADLSRASLVPGLVGARCDDGFLLLSGEPPPLGPYVLPGNNFHVYDYALFWEAVRRDAARRLAAWRR
jgi:hypothetical protein